MIKKSGRRTPNLNKITHDDSKLVCPQFLLMNSIVKKDVHLMKIKINGYCITNQSKFLQLANESEVKMFSIS